MIDQLVITIRRCHLNVAGPVGGLQRIFVVVFDLVILTGVVARRRDRHVLIFGHAALDEWIRRLEHSSNALGDKRPFLPHAQLQVY